MNDAMPGGGRTGPGAFDRVRNREAETAPLYGAETVLVVEDNAEVLAAANGAEALSLAKVHPRPIDLLITDVVMPGITRKQLAAQLAETRPDIKCVYASGYTADLIAHQGALEPGVNFVQKPSLRSRPGDAAT